jgi:hypothetical protein
MELRICLFQQKDPQLIPLAAREHRAPTMTRDQIIDDHIHPLPTLTELDNIPPGVLDALCLKKASDQLRALG